MTNRSFMGLGGLIATILVWIFAGAVFATCVAIGWFANEFTTDIFRRKQ